MTREDAIYWIKNLAVLSVEKDMPQIEEALNMAIEALADRKTEPQTEKCPHDSICAKPCKECGACEEECGMWKALKDIPQTENE